MNKIAQKLGMNEQLSKILFCDNSRCFRRSYNLRTAVFQIRL